MILIVQLPYAAYNRTMAMWNQVSLSSHESSSMAMKSSMVSESMAVPWSNYIAYNRTTAIWDQIYLFTYESSSMAILPQLPSLQQNDGHMGSGQFI